MKDFTIDMYHHELKALIVNTRKEPRNGLALHCIAVELMPDNSVVMVSTTGPALTAIKSKAVHELKLKEPLQILIQVRDIKHILAGLSKKENYVELTCSNGNLSLATTYFSQPEEAFPNWRRVVPDNTVKIQEGSVTLSPYLYADAVKTLALYRQEKHTTRSTFTDFEFHQRGEENPCILKIPNDNDCIVVVMPMRIDTPRPYKKPDWI